MGDFAAMREVAGVGEGGDDAAVGSASGVPSAVVEVEMGVDDDVDFFRTNLGGFERVRELLLGAINLVEFGRELVADAGFDGDGVLTGAHDDGIEAEKDAVLRVGGSAFFPERFGDDAEHGSAVEEIVAVGEDGELEVADGGAAADGVGGVGALAGVGHYR